MSRLLFDHQTYGAHTLEQFRAHKLSKHKSTKNRDQILTLLEERMDTFSCTYRILAQMKKLTPTLWHT